MNQQPSLARIAALLLVATPLSAWTATPSSGTLDPGDSTLTYTAGPFSTSNATPVPLVDNGPHCNNPAQPCDEYTLTVNLPVGYVAAHPNAAARVTAGWTDGGTGKSDYDLYVYQGTVTTLSGSEQAYAQSASSNNPEVASFSLGADGQTTFTVIVVPYTAGGESVNVQIELLPGTTSGGGGGGFGGADPTVPGAPRFQNFYAPNGTSAQPGNGEFNIGFDPKTKRIMTMNTGPIWRLTPPEVTSATQATARPESCEALWEDKSSTVTDTGLDPILWTDQKTGRTFAINNTTGSMAGVYSDDDGETWLTPASLPNGGADHETIGSGPYPAALSLLSTPINQGQYLLYCSQDIVGPAMCQRSDTLGTAWGSGVPAYTGQAGDGTCSGLHGHVHISADGTAWLPVRDCPGGVQGGAVSTDAGTTWSPFTLPASHSQSTGADPSVGLDSDNTAYYCYVNNEPVPSGNPPEGHMHVAVSKDGGKTWINDTDVGITHGIVNAAEPEAVGGSSGRAACGFLGTNVPGDYQALSFTGVWYAFMATTYDGGQTWTTVNMTPNDPVQAHTGIWQQGGGAQDRNLLDFNEITTDDKGFPLYGYSDGCTSDGCINGTAGNDFTAWMRVARQSGGKSLFAANDLVEPVKPKAACLAATRDDKASHLTWTAPDNGGADIAYYTIWRSDTTGTETLIAQTTTPVTQYDDTTADPSIPDYFYEVKAINNQGESVFSNEVDAQVTVAPSLGDICTAPGYIELTDPAADNTGGVPGTDLLFFRLAQPFVQDGVLMLAFDLETDPGQSPQPVSTSWYVSMKILDPAPAATFHYRAVHMTWNSTTPTFESYTPGANGSGGVDGRFVTSGSQIAADPSSSYAAPYNHVSIVVKASDLGLNTGDSIAGFVAGVSQTAGVVTNLLDQMPDSLSYTTPYQVRYNGLCAPDMIFTDGFGSDQAR